MANACTVAKTSLGLFLFCMTHPAAQVWTARIEEPTGLYRRTDEVVAVPLRQLQGCSGVFTVTDSGGRELPWQVSRDELLFPVSLIPGELPEYRIGCSPLAATPEFKNQILLRRIGMRRVELGNARFRVVIDLGVPAVVEAYSLTAGPQRMLNLVETTPENADALHGDIHEKGQIGPPPVPGVGGENVGWTTLEGSGPMTDVELLENGPLRGRLRLRRNDETWELTWTGGSAALRWKARRGFRFASVSAEPYLPFDRFLDGSEYRWPSGPDDEEPSDSRIAARPWNKPPGGHAVYYQQAENYGALGIVALDAELNWKGMGARRFQAEKSEGETEIALTFPRWRGKDTVLEARMENRILRQPVLVQVQGSEPQNLSVIRPAAREQQYQILAGAAVATPFQPEILVLDGGWELAWSEKGAGRPLTGWRQVRVPGSVHTQWLDPAKIYTREAEWISSKEWWYRRHFRLPPGFRDRKLRLEFEATDYYADIYLNGQYLGRHEGYIDPYELDVSNRVRDGEENELAVRVWTAVHYYWKHRPYNIKGSYGAVDQKPDDITALGITRPVKLIASQRATIKDVAVDTRLTNEGAEVEVEIEAGEIDGDQTWELTLSPRTFQSSLCYQIRTSALDSRSRFRIPMKDPRLWWTWDHGRPDLYTLDIRLLDARGTAIDGKSLAVGVREIEKIGWNFYLNRRRLFIRGTNYYYHLFLSEMDRAKYARDLRLMRQMNVNMIRLHCHFTNREFYDLADESGILVWQDFLEAWYPQDTAFSLRAAALYDHHIRYVRNHPSIAIWATSDEEDLENYRDLTKHLAPRAALLDPQRRPVIRSTGRYGDAHVYNGWYGGSIWEYATMTEAFVSELGATALPNYETLIKFLPHHWPIQDFAEDWMWRRLQIPEAMRAWGEPGQMSLKEYIPQTQAYVARLFQLALERQRRRKAEGAGGILHFHAIDIWPSVTMAAIDFERIPTKVFGTVQRSFAPVLASLEYDRDRWRPGESIRCGVWAINDLWDPLPNAQVHWRIQSASGQLLRQGHWTVSMDPDSARKLGDVEWDATVPGSYELRAEVRNAKGEPLSENLFEFQVLPPSAP